MFDAFAWATSVVVGLATLLIVYVIKFYWDRGNYPPGPFPLPLLGNLLHFRNNDHIHETILKFRDKFGPIYTVYVGMQKVVVMTDLEVAAEAFKGKFLAGRPVNEIMTEGFVGTEGRDIIMGDFNREWEVLRRVAHAATRKYAVTENLQDLVADVVDDVMMTIQKNEGNKSFDPTDYLYLIIFSIIARSAYGSKYTLDDPEFTEQVRIDKDFKELGARLFILAAFPFVKYIDRKTHRKFFGGFANRRALLKTKYQEHVASYQDGEIRDFCDALISAKKEAEAEDSSNLKYLSDANLVCTLFDLFLAGTDTTLNTTQWILLLMTEHSEMQLKMRKEISDVIGDAQPNLDHKADCHYVNCFIAETLRFRNPAPLGVGHTAMADLKLGHFDIKKGTDTILHQAAVLMDEKHWTNANIFNPERFLDTEGKFSLRLNPAFVAFGVGRRECLGQKLALVDLFFIVTRLLQSTRGSMFCFPNGPGSVNLNGDSNVATNFVPHSYQIVIKADSN